jgi:hypothetical protein
VNSSEVIRKLILFCTDILGQVHGEYFNKHLTGKKGSNNRTMTTSLVNSSFVHKLNQLLHFKFFISSLM